MAWRRRALLVGVGGVGLGYLADQRRRRLPDRFVLELDLSSTRLVEKRPSSILERLSLRSSGVECLPLHEAASAIRAAADDPRVCGIVAHLGNSGGLSLSLTATQELCAAVTAFREARQAGDGKVGSEAASTFAYASEYQGACQYLFATSFGGVYQQPGAPLRMPSLSVRIPEADPDPRASP